MYNDIYKCIFWTLLSGKNVERSSPGSWFSMRVVPYPYFENFCYGGSHRNIPKCFTTAIGFNREFTFICTFIIDWRSRVDATTAVGLRGARHPPERIEGVSNSGVKFSTVLGGARFVIDWSLAAYTKGQAIAFRQCRGNHKKNKKMGAGKRGILFFNLILGLLLFFSCRELWSMWCKINSSENKKSDEF